MPMPMWAVWIMGTSLAPSPIERVTTEGIFLRTIPTIWAFCLGDTRAQMTDLTMLASSRKRDVRVSSACMASSSAVRAAASTIKQASPRGSALRPASRRSTRVWSWGRRVLFGGKPLAFRGLRSPSPATRRSCSICLVMSWQLYAIFSAVPTLSPVSIQTRIPAVRRDEIASPTPSWSLSSMAVAPMSLRFCSISSMTANRLSCRLASATSASCMRVAQSS
mmetsp:Transcript_23913/g.70136  ORF Transcript_23913/g.70136 Transcript_23913/m.70136 type:complete len:221 (-) Transcript_23913:2135-2797(-)